MFCCGNLWCRLATGRTGGQNEPQRLVSAYFLLALVCHLCVKTFERKKETEKTQFQALYNFFLPLPCSQPSLALDTSKITVQMKKNILIWTMFPKTCKILLQEKSHEKAWYLVMHWKKWNTFFLQTLRDYWIFFLQIQWKCNYFQLYGIRRLILRKLFLSSTSSLDSGAIPLMVGNPMDHSPTLVTWPQKPPWINYKIMI